MKITYKRKQTNAQVIRRLHLNDSSTKKFIHVTLKKFCEPYVPFRTGMLAIHKAEAHEDHVLYNVPYAKKMHSGRGGRINKSFHPLATDHWEQAMARAKGKYYLKAIADYIKNKNR